jgi:outer membrane protein insertion porin family
LGAVLAPLLGVFAASAQPAPEPAPAASTSVSASVPPPPEPAPCPVCDSDEAGKLGVRYVLEGIRVRGNSRTRDRTILRYVPFRAGDEIDLDDTRLELTRYRLLGTGYFSDVQLSLAKGSRHGAVHLDIEVVERNTIVINDVWLGLSADVTPSGDARPLTAYGGADVAETNFYGTGILLGGAVAVADRQSAYRLRFTDPSFLGSKWIVTTSLVSNNARDFLGTRNVLWEGAENESADYAIVRYRRRGGMLGIGYDLSPSTRLMAHYNIETIDASVPRVASHHRGFDIEPIDFHLIDGRSLLSYVSVQLDDDTRNDPVLPSRGHHLQLAGDFSLTTFGSDYSFLRAQIRGSQWWQVGRHEHVFRLDGFAGAVVGDAPLFMRFFVGDFSDFLPNRVLDLNFDRRPPPNFLRTSIVEMRYEDFAARVLAEYRIPLHRSHRSVYGVDLFASAGFFSLLSRRDVVSPARGYSGLGKIPIDLNFNIGVRISTKAGGFVLAIANAVGFLPIHQSGP